MWLSKKCQLLCCGIWLWWLRSLPTTGLASQHIKVSIQTRWHGRSGPLLQGVWAPELFTRIGSPTFPQTWESVHWRVWAKDLSRISSCPLLFPYDFRVFLCFCGVFLFFIFNEAFSGTFKNRTRAFWPRDCFWRGFFIISLFVKDQPDLRGDDTVLCCHLDGVSRGPAEAAPCVTGGLMGVTKENSLITQNHFLMCSSRILTSLRYPVCTHFCQPWV